MTSTEARAFADDLQERVTQLGDRTGEGQYLGQCLAVIRTLATQIDALTVGLDVPAEVDNTPPRLDE